MASTSKEKPTWYRGTVKEVPAGDCLVLVPPNRKYEKKLTLSCIIAPRLANHYRGTLDEPFAWDSREFLRKLLIGEEIVFRVDYTVAAIKREFGTVYLGDQNVACLVVANGWAKVKEQNYQHRSEPTLPYLPELLRLQQEAKHNGLGRWNKLPGAYEASMRKLPPSAMGVPGSVDVSSLMKDDRRGLAVKGIVEQVRDGSTIRVSLLPEFESLQIFVAGIQAPSTARRVLVDGVAQPVTSTGKTDGKASANSSASLTPAQKYAATMPPSPEMSSDAKEAKQFTELNVLNRDVHVVFLGVDKFNNPLAAVYYFDRDMPKNLAIEVVENGWAKYVDWSAEVIPEEERRQLKIAELKAKQDRLGIWTNYVPPPTNSKAIHDQDFTGTVVEVVSGDCIIVADDALPYGSPSAERRVNLSSIRCPKMGNLRKDEKPAPYAYVAREYLRLQVIGHQVYVSMEYTKKVSMGDEADSRIMDFGSVFLCPSKVNGDNSSLSAHGINVGEMVVARGFGLVVRHKDFEERSKYFDALMEAESRATEAKKGIHSSRDPPVMNNTDLATASPKKAKEFFPYLQRSPTHTAIVECVYSGHRFKLLIPTEACSISFCFSGVRCPAWNEPYYDEAVALLRRTIMQREVEIQLQAVDGKGIFLGSLWHAKKNMAIVLLEAGLAKIQTGLRDDVIVDDCLVQAEKSAKQQKLKIWENYVEGQEILKLSANEGRQKEVIKVVITEVLGGGQFYIRTVGDQKVGSIEQQLASLNLEDAPALGTFSPRKGDIVVAQFSADKSWNRAMIISAPRGGVKSLEDEFEVFYIDYGNREVVHYGSLRPLNRELSSTPGLAQFCRLAYIRVPHLGEDFGEEAAEYFSEWTLKSGKEFSALIEGRERYGKGQGCGIGSGTVLYVTLVDDETSTTINTTMLEAGLARIEKRRKWESKEKQSIVKEWEAYQEEAKSHRLNIWQYGDISSDEEELTRPARRNGGGRR